MYVCDGIRKNKYIIFIIKGRGNRQICLDNFINNFIFVTTIIYM